MAANGPTVELSQWTLEESWANDHLVIVATFGNHFTLNDALEKFRAEGLRFETEKGHIVKIFLDKNTEERAEKVRKIIREGFGYVEPL